MLQKSSKDKRYENINIVYIVDVLSAISADNIKRPDCYKYTHGIEAIQDNNTEEAIRKFIFDTVASDIIGRQNYMTADGNITDGMVINLRDVKLGNIHLNDIKASAVKLQSAPLPLGQSVFSKLRKIEIDNDKKLLRIKYHKKVK